MGVLETALRSIELLIGYASHRRSERSRLLPSVLGRCRFCGLTYRPALLCRTFPFSV